MMLSLELALRELRRDWIAAGCFVAALIGVLGPMLILLALKNGVIGAMVERLVQDPANREIIAVGTGQHDAAFFDWLGERTDVAFVTPATRSINALADAVRLADGGRSERSVALVVSAKGDPLLGDADVSTGRVWISHALSEKLGVVSGTDLTLFIGREIDGLQETAQMQVSVAGIVSAERYRRPAIFLSLEDMLVIERFRDSMAVTLDTWLADRSRPKTYASFRLYARDLADLEPVMAALAERGVETRPRAENAVLLLKFRDNLNLIYIVIAALALGGFWAAMAANLRGMVERRRLAYSLLRLVGLPKMSRWMLPLWHSLMLIGTGILLSLLIVWGALTVLNMTFPSEGAEVIATLSQRDIAGTFVLGALTAVTAAVWAMRAAAAIPSQEVLRNG